MGLSIYIWKIMELNFSKVIRSITCLSATRKILTSFLMENIYKFMEQNADVSCIDQIWINCTIFENCHTRHKDQILVNRMIFKKSHTKHRNRGFACIYYKNLFDSIPHSQILISLIIFKMSPVILNFLNIASVENESPILPL